MASESPLTVSPEVAALLRARAAETHRDPQAMADEILRNALEPNFIGDDARRQAFNAELRDRVATVRAGGPVVSEEESLAALGLEPDYNDEA